MSEKKAQYSKPASQVDLERRLENGNKSNRVLSTSDQYDASDSEGGRDYRVEDNDVSNYVGTSAEYATYASKTEAPLKAKDSAEKKVFDSFAKSAVPAPLRVEGNVEYEGEVKAADEAAKASEEARASNESQSSGDSSNK
ncbi:MAG: hypothetical protein [Phage AS32]|nr:MAG: hypothetical protein [Phage AS32]